ncbi:MAG: hypothetical protein DRJ52_01475 [Thermoprotei archaeon]|mgnify:CR=1 FL=1|nr:MAG: hypothetical protein DRJ52_01475 [Thermoprotei archaeon]RLF00153.1 MAG: hypothetical protein DRJ63_03295 [Thermoprotei archaeon]HDI75002.1 polyprenyl synthetase family protein [Thermoprotei archaeon]
MKINEAIARYKPLIERKLEEILNREIASIGHVELREFYLALKEFILRGGKRLRPLSLIIAYRGVSASEENYSLDNIVEISTCVEFLHNSTLIHDDIIDRDRIRRGKPSFHVVFENKYSGVTEAQHLGLSYGILGGDELFNIGFKVLCQAKHKLRFSLQRALIEYTKAYSDIVKGEILDIFYSVVRNASLDDYFRIIEYKTAALFEASIAIGLILGGASSETLLNMKNYASLVAKAFQIKDDLLGLYGSEEKIGKPVGSDIREGKATILSVLALSKLEKEDKDRFLSLLGRKDLTLDDVEWVRSVLDFYGIRDEAEKYMVEFSSRALTYLRRAELKQDSLEFFEELANYVMKREY